MKIKIENEYRPITIKLETENEAHLFMRIMQMADLSDDKSKDFADEIYLELQRLGLKAL